MSTQTFLQSFIVLHLIGFLLFAGTTIADYVTFKQFWKQYDRDSSHATLVMQAMANFPLFMRLGIGLILLSGIGIMYLTHGVFGEQIWFRIKFGLVIIVIVNAILVGQRQRVNLKKTLAAGAGQPVDKIRGNLNWFHFVQLALLLVIIVLSIFKFS